LLIALVRFIKAFFLVANKLFSQCPCNKSGNSRFRFVAWLLPEPETDVDACALGSSEANATVAGGNATAVATVADAVTYTGYAGRSEWMGVVLSAKRIMWLMHFNCRWPSETRPLAVVNAERHLVAPTCNIHLQQPPAPCAPFNLIKVRIWITLRHF